MPTKLLILGGTSEGSQLAQALAGAGGVAALVSLAGRTRAPGALPLPCRIGGFGGADGLARFLREERFEAVVDATHPFASRISANAEAACRALAMPLAVFTRPPWAPEAGDAWDEVATLDDAVAALGAVPRRVFLTTGRLGLAAFRAGPQHRYLLRSIDPPAEADLPPHCRVILARGPFPAAAEEGLMRAAGIEVLVTKNSGGAASHAKLEAARRLGLRVVMVRPPARSAGALFHDLAGVLAWIAAHQAGRP